MKWMLTCLLLFVVCIPLSAQWSTLTMPMGQTQHGGAATFDKVYLASGNDPGFTYTTLIQTYDRNTGLWNEEPIELSEGRGKVACAVNGNRLVCGGGMIFETLVPTSAAEVFDIAANQLLQVDHLSVPRVEMGVASVGDKILFAGGMDQADGGITYVTTEYDAVDIYDVVDDEWSTSVLSQARSGMATAVLGDRAYFAGGYLGDSTVSDRIDIYDASDGSWSTATLSVARAFYGGGVAIGSKVMFAGGQLVDQSATDIVDVYDTLTGLWTTANISVARYGIQAAATGDYALFAGGGGGYLHDWYYTSSSNVVDIFNDESGQWTTATMTNERINFVTVASGNQIFMCGGFDYPMFDLVASVDVFTDASTIGMPEGQLGAAFSVAPNPFEQELRVAGVDAARMELFDALGARVVALPLQNGRVDQLPPLAPGLYYLKAIDANGRILGTSGPLMRTASVH